MRRNVLSGVLFLQNQTWTWRKEARWQSIFTVRKKKSVGESLCGCVHSFNPGRGCFGANRLSFLVLWQEHQMCGTQVPPTDSRWYNGWAEISPLELDVYWGKPSNSDLFPRVSRVICPTSAAVSLFTQDYASFSELNIVVKASLVLHGQAKNIILKTPDTNVSSSTAALSHTSKVAARSQSGVCVCSKDTSSITVFCLFPTHLCFLFSQVTVTVSPESAIAQYGGVPWWIILVAVLAGILILALLVFLLWKVSTGDVAHVW